jgi:hypothetical protein
MKTFAVALANNLIAMQVIESSGGSQEWIALRKDYEKKLMDFAPSGSGFDNGTKLVRDECTHCKLVFTTSFHHMDEHGFYTFWTEHTVTVKASFVFDFDIYVSGKNVNEIKDYIADVFNSWLSSEAPKAQWEIDWEKRREEAESKAAGTGV